MVARGLDWIGRVTLAVLIGLFCVVMSGHGHADTLAALRKTGILQCGSNGASEDYTRIDSHGDLTDLADQICKAVAVAVLGTGGKSKTHAWPDQRQMLESLKAGTTDLAIGVTPTIPLQLAFDLGYAPPVFYDGQGILATQGVNQVAQLAGTRVCFVIDQGMAAHLRDAMAERHIPYAPYPFSEVGEMQAAAGDGRCEAITGDVSQLINLRAGYAPMEKRFHLLPDRLTQDPLAPAFRADDRAFGIVVNAVVNLLIDADARGITAASVDRMAATEDAVFGQRSRLGRAMGLPDDWAAAVIKAVGNYGEIYERTLGTDSDFGLPRGLNQPVSRGGAMYALPLQ